MKSFFDRTIFQSGRRRFILSCYVIAILIRLGFVMFFGSPTQPPGIEQPVIALNIYHGYGFSLHTMYTSLNPERRAAMTKPPTFVGSNQPPLIPYLTALAFLVFGASRTAYWSLMLLNCIIGAFLPLVVYRTAKLLVDERTSRLSTISTVAFLPAAFAVVTYSGSPYYMLSASLFLSGCIGIWKHPRAVQNYWIAGLAGGVTALLRTEFWVVGTLVLLITMFATRSRIDNTTLLKYVSLALLLHLAIGGSWVLRNYEVFGKILPTGTHPWYEIWRGNNEYANGESRDPEGGVVTVDTIRFRRITLRMDSLPYNQHFETKLDGIFKQEAISYIGSHPAAYLLLSAKRALFLFSFDPSDPRGRNPFYAGLMIVVSVLTLLGGFALLRMYPQSFTRSPALIITSIFAIYFVELTISQMLPRYQIYVFSMMLPLTGIALTEIGRWLKKVG
jgi:hypothetical protein